MHTTTTFEATRRLRVRALGSRGGSFGGPVRGALLAALLALGGCAGAPPPPKPTVVSATVQASANVNPDSRKRASPVVVRVFELKSSAAFDAADFLSLFERDQATLAAEMGSREEFTLRPGDSKPWEKTLAPDVRFIGVIAAFRDIERARWKVLVPVKPNMRNVVTIKADDITVTGTVVAQ
jgi:type VI secretion system protein VasD